MGAMACSVARANMHLKAAIETMSPGFVRRHSLTYCGFLGRVPCVQSKGRIAAALCSTRRESLTGPV